MEDEIRKKLLLFVFLLLRDYIIIGDFNKIIKDIESISDDTVIYTDEGLADFARHQLNKIIN